MATWDIHHTRSITANVVSQLVAFRWRIHRVKRTRSSGYVLANHGRERLKIRISDHPPNLRRRIPDISIHPGGRTIEHLVALLESWGRRFRRNRAASKRPRPRIRRA